MFLKKLEIIGFKSFPEKTTLHFQPGLTTIVGPNGCGKSNVSDAIRWVLGEQSAKALRGSKMEDCIFNGTDSRKPLGMAEVCITFADCEEVVNSDFNEITITRRVFRSGDSQYFINKTPCRLKDIHKTFMDTGIGTTSYSVLEQGRVDQILSSRPEDRRTVFEEASGITKFKNDKKEGIRKLEQTEANLIRLADVIREVKRQIGSLQRQAGKARRYKSMREELRKLDIYLTKKRASQFDKHMQEAREQMAEITSRRSGLHAELGEAEKATALMRQNISRTEREIADSHEREVKARSSLAHTDELIKMNLKQVEEYSSLAQRDEKEMEQASAKASSGKEAIIQLSTNISETKQKHDKTEKDLETARNNLKEHEQSMDQLRRLIKELQDESIQTESRYSSLQNKLTQIESRQRSESVQKERLFAEQSQLQRSLDSYQNRKNQIDQVVKNAEKESSAQEKLLSQAKARLEPMQGELNEKNDRISRLREKLTSTLARKEMLEESLRLSCPETKGLDTDSEMIMGSLISQVDVEPEYSVAAQATLSSWVNALLVKNMHTACTVAEMLKENNKIPARLLAIEHGHEEQRVEMNLERLINHISCSIRIQPLMERLLNNVFIVETLQDIPENPPSSASFVTRDGLLAEDKGKVYVFTEDDETSSVRWKQELDNSLSMINDITDQLKNIEDEKHQILSRISETRTQVEQAAENFNKKQHELAVRQGEYQIVSTEADQARERLNTVTWELNELTSSDKIPNTDEDTSIEEKLSSLKSRRHELSKIIAERNAEINDMQTTHSHLQSAITECSVAAARVSQQLDMLHSQKTLTEKNIEELLKTENDKLQNIADYKNRIEELQASVKEAGDKLAEFKKTAQDNETKAESLKTNLEKQNEQLSELEKNTSFRRQQLEKLQEKKADLDLRYNQASMKKQARFEKICSDYNISQEGVLDEPDPEWEGVVPEDETVETKITELRTKLEAMGPVNLIAIEEYEELKERHIFLTKQEEDLVNAKDHLLKVIREINKTTSEMFRSTFESVNQNFQSMFKQLFNGGSAKLVLVNEEDVLECGIEIIARPPGKRLQNISLLSGGERTLTAVSLLFAIYMIKPSPFCLLDELDAALDETNIGRFVHILKGFLRQSQFVVITHNRKTIAAAETIYGVTMPEKGVSKIVSMRFKNHGEPVAEEEAGVSA